MEINLGDLKKEIFTGREFGKEVRKRFNIAQYDNKNEIIQITIPDNTYSISSSFLGGMLEDSMKLFNTKDEFYKKFSFVGKRDFHVIIDSMLYRVLISKQFETKSKRKTLWGKLLNFFKAENN